MPTPLKIINKCFNGYLTVIRPSAQWSDNVRKNPSAVELYISTHGKSLVQSNCLVGTNCCIKRLKESQQFLNFSPLAFPHSKRNTFGPEVLPFWQILEIHNPFDEALPSPKLAGFYSSSFPALPDALPPSLLTVCRIAARKVQKVTALLSFFFCHPLEWNVEEEEE